MTSKSRQSAVVTSQINALSAVARAMEKALRNTGYAEFFQPPNLLGSWDGDTLDIDNMAEAFSRLDLEEQFREAIANPADPGVVGDLPAILVQGDFLAQLERAYRARHMSSIRSKTHAAARHRGHGHHNGPLQLGMTNYIKQLLKMASG